MRKLFLIPARGGSKGLPRKNILPLAGKPMIYYTLDAAIGASEPGDEICVSSDDHEVIAIVENYGIEVPFVRPSELASDTANSQQVIDHAIQWYQDKGKFFDILVLMQPTSPLRTAQHLKEAINLWTDEVDMVVSVKETAANPYYVLFEEDQYGFLKKSKEGGFTRRQDCPKVYEYNGAIYIFSEDSIMSKTLGTLDRIKKYVMPKEVSIDIDDQTDFRLAELIIQESQK